MAQLHEDSKESSTERDDLKEPFTEVPNKWLVYDLWRDHLQDPSPGNHEHVPWVDKPRSLIYLSEKARISIAKRLREAGVYLPCINRLLRAAILVEERATGYKKFVQQFL
ncbi:hypothetical protein C5167_038712 [Papaver somniferum]|uniref:Uncharacterized protein n=1 Tax=Papaver somniferum TaxID=3469 RepID=A0A4Y7IEC2_PAPSO|nr:hypothetical protein C5167_038712 [Papaver somniferum]